MADRVTDIETQLACITDVREKVDAMNALAVELRFSDLPRALTLSQEALGLATRPESGHPTYRKGQATSIYNLGRFRIQLGHYDSALSLLLKSLSLFQEMGDLASSANVLNALGATYVHLCSYADALDCFFKALEINAALDPRGEDGRILNNIGYVYLQLNDYAKAISYLQKSLCISRNIGEKSEQAHALDNICSAHYRLGDYDSALTCGLHSVQLYQEVGDKQGEARGLNSVGEVYQAQSNYTQALSCFRRALHISEKIGLRHEVMEALQRIGNAYHLQGRADAALAHLGRALNIAREIHAKQALYECHQAMAAVYKQLGDFEKALAHYEQFYTIKEEVFNEEADKRLKNLEVVHRVETARREAEIYQLKNMALQQEVEERKQSQAALRQLAITDPLTKLFNRHYFFAVANYVCKEAARRRSPISAIMLDIDYFKRVNDMYGHIAGDQVLIALGKQIRHSMRDADIVGRFGGEEFVILLPDTNLSQARRAAEHLRQAVAAQPVITDKGPVSITISLGVAGLKHDNRTSIETLLEQADQALYLAKQTGRNCTAAYQ